MEAALMLSQTEADRILEHSGCPQNKYHPFRSLKYWRPRSPCQVVEVLLTPTFLSLPICPETFQWAKDYCSHAQQIQQ